MITALLVFLQLLTQIVFHLMLGNIHMRCASLDQQLSMSMERKSIWGIFLFNNTRTWGKWSGPPEDPYSEIIFEHGTSCWNGPERTLKVRFSCGSEEKILSVSEPAKCEYFADMETSAVCPDRIVSDEKEEKHSDIGSENNAPIHADL